MTLINFQIVVTFFVLWIFAGLSTSFSLDSINATFSSASTSEYPSSASSSSTISISIPATSDTNLTQNRLDFTRPSCNYPNSNATYQRYILTKENSAFAENLYIMGVWAQYFLVYCGVNFPASKNGINNFHSKFSFSFKTCLQECLEYNKAFPSDIDLVLACNAISFSDEVCYMKNLVPSFDKLQPQEDESVDSAIVRFFKVNEAL